MTNTAMKSLTKRPHSAASEIQAKAAPHSAAMQKTPKWGEAEPKRATKASVVEELLTRQEGATLDTICKTTGWQAHTCRAFLTGLRKKGMKITRDKDAGGITIYRLGEAIEQGTAN